MHIDIDKTNVKCPICNSFDTLECSHKLSFCCNCNHTFQTDLKVTKVYDDAYIRPYNALHTEEMSKVRWDFIDEILELDPGSKILDIGYGNGAFLKYVQKLGMDVYGIDVHGQDYGIKEVTYDVDIEYDLVCFFDSLEHLPSFSPLFQLNMKNMVVSIPFVPPFFLGSPLSWKHYKPGEHLHYFSPNSLSYLVSLLGGKYSLELMEDGFPEDDLRGKFYTFGGNVYDNIYTTVFSR